MRTGLLAVAMLAVASMAGAHVTVSPEQSKAGAGERYTVRVPTEGKIATVSLELEVPTDMRVASVLVGGGFTYELRREGDRVAAITWTQTIGPGETAEFVFFAVNPKSTQVSWRAHQRFADGTSADWTGVEGDRRPAAVTKLVAGR